MRFLILLFLIVFSPLFSNAAPPEDTAPYYTPESLKDWRLWVKERRPNLDCPSLQSNLECVWPGRLVLDLNATGGTFILEGHAYAKKVEVLLPGGGEKNDQGVWPQDVNFNASSSSQSSEATVLEKNSVPVALINKGEFQISGSFRWNEMPKYIKIPNQIAEIKLIVDGKTIKAAEPNSAGELWIAETVPTQTVEQDGVKIDSFRLLSDGVPFRIDNRIIVTVSGRSRDIDLGATLLPNSALLDIQSELPFRLNEDKSIVLQAKPGRHALTVSSFLPSDTNEILPYQNKVSDWPEQEIWAFLANGQYRSIRFSGASQIDPKQTELPEEWRGFPAYLVDNDTGLSIEVLQRGEGVPRPNDLNLHREMWLDFNGSNLSVRDNFSGTMYGRWRLDALAETKVGRISVNNQDKVITHNKDNQLSGVELRQSSINVNADSSINLKDNISVIGWDTEVRKLSAALQLPPGFSLIAASGPDKVPGSWVSRWTLMDFFLIFLIAVAAGKLLGFGWGLISLVTLIIVHGESGAPLQLWFHLLAAFALLKALPEGTTKKWANSYYWLVILFLGASIFFFSLSQIVYAIYPHLNLSISEINSYQNSISSKGLSYSPNVAYNDERISNSFVSIVYFIEGSLGALVMIGALILSVVSLFTRKFKAALGLFAFFILILIVRSLVGSFFGYQGGYDNRYAATPAATNYNQQAEYMAEGGVAASPDSASGSVSGGVEVYSRTDSIASLSAKVGGVDQNKLALKKRQKQYDPSALIQTGQGMPDWRWQGYQLVWDGPVRQDQTLSFYILNPMQNMLLGFLRVILLAVMLCAFLGKNLLRLPFSLNKPALKIGGVSNIVASISLYILTPIIIFLTQANFAYSDPYPSESLLNELEQKEASLKCTKDCLAVHALNIRAEEDTFYINAKVSADGDSAFALPSSSDQVYPKNVAVNGTPTTAMRRDNSGVIWVKVPNGASTVDAELKVVDRNIINLRFVQIPGYVFIDSLTTNEASPYWNVDGINALGKIKDSLQFSRRQKEDNLEQNKESVSKTADNKIPDWFKITRRINIGIPFTVFTTAERLGSSDRPTIGRFNLLATEAVSTEGISIEKGEAVVQFPRGTSVVSWESTINQEDTLNLKATDNFQTVEDWYIECEEMFNCTLPIENNLTPELTIIDGKHQFYFRPYAGESVQVGYLKPKGLAGENLTIRGVSLKRNSGEKILNSELNLNVQSSRGDVLPITLPKGAVLLSTSVDGANIPLTLKENILEIPIAPKLQQIKIVYENNYLRRTLFKPETVDLGRSFVNANLNIQMPSERWIILTGGPTWGPAVLFWGKLIVVVFVALMLGSIRQLPVKTYQWILLGLGIATLPSSLVAVPLLWFLLMDYRANFKHHDSGWFYPLQLGIVLFSVVTVSTIYIAVQNGLILDPDMQIFGNGSTATDLRWYQDRGRGSLPQVWVLSFPIWVWRAFALAWSLWVVFAFINWLKWGWNCFTAGGIWRAQAKTSTE